ncbi:hypothetical protein A176_000608 [Myxococcus hansupus]|uniref:Uncharacterized protein n=1 Tax=Pseudomyxococcus hansupus TaxID=1297742 RepID=A0A0H4WK18_9BACT|nr:hypothetical protein [Myxococcus hansupus]AKQ63696.1 hypothetical protein A176_000608 [Myxococcus hansupus]
MDELEDIFGWPLLAHVPSFNPILDVAERYRVAPKSELPPHRLLFSFGDRDPLAPHHDWLNLESPSEEGNCQVVRMPFGADSWKTKLRREAIGLRELLFLWAMEHVRMPTLPHQDPYVRRDGDSTPTAEDLARLLEKMGFVQLHFPRYNMLFEREGAAARLYRHPGSPQFNLRVGVQHPEELKRVQVLLEDNTNMGKSPF